MCNECEIAIIETNDNNINDTANGDVDMGTRPTKTNKLSWISMTTNIICHIIIFGFTAFITYMCLVRDVKLFHWHPLLLTFGVSNDYLDYFQKQIFS